MAAATQSAPTSGAASSTTPQDQSDTNPVQGWFSDTWQKMPWNGDKSASADGSSGEGNGSTDQQPTTDGNKSVLPDQITNLWQKMPWNGTANGDADATKSGDSDATVSSKKTGNNTGDTNTDGSKSVQDQFTDFWHKMPWNSTANDSTQPATNGTANTNGDANADGQQPASATAGLTDLWSKTTGFFEKIAPSTTTSTTPNADANASANANANHSSADTAQAQKTASSSEA